MRDDQLRTYAGHLTALASAAADTKKLFVIWPEENQHAGSEIDGVRDVRSKTGRPGSSAVSSAGRGLPTGRPLGSRSAIIHPPSSQARRKPLAVAAR